MIDFEKTLMPWIGKSRKLIDYFFIDRISQHGIELTKVQWILLMKLKERNGEPQHNLAFLTNRDKASLTRLLTTMESKNLVARIPEESDHRINNIYITSHGEKILKQSIPIVNQMIDEMQEGLTEEEKELAINVLKKIIDNIKLQDISCS